MLVPIKYPIRDSDESMGSVATSGASCVADVHSPPTRQGYYDLDVINTPYIVHLCDVLNVNRTELLEHFRLPFLLSKDVLQFVGYDPRICIQFEQAGLLFR